MNTGPILRLAVPQIRQFETPGMTPAAAVIVVTTNRSVSGVPGPGMQSLSFANVHPAGQQPSPPAHVAIALCVHAALQVDELPVSTSVVQALLSLHIVGQLACGSQVSPDSTTPLPHDARQSESLTLVHPAGQQPSPPIQSLIGELAHRTLQFAALPVTRSIVHVFPSLHVVTQLAGGSQVSFGSRLPSPHDGEQSVSVAWLQPAGQQPSPPRHAVIASGNADRRSRPRPW